MTKKASLPAVIPENDPQAVVSAFVTIEGVKFKVTGRTGVTAPMIQDTIFIYMEVARAAYGGRRKFLDLPQWHERPNYGPHNGEPRVVAFGKVITVGGAGAKEIEINKCLETSTAQDLLDLVWVMYDALAAPLGLSISDESQLVPYNEEDIPQ